MRTPHHIREAVRLGIGAARRNVLPGSVLWLTGIVLVTAYYRLPAVTDFLDQVGIWKVQFSPWLGMISTATFGSLVPWIAQKFLLRDQPALPVHQVILLFLFWAVHGLQVDILYKIQDSIFGSGRDFATIAKKTLVDEFIWVPFLAVPQLVLGYLFIEKDLSPARFRAALQQRSFLSRAIPLMIANWVVWIPTCSLVYLFPLPLQLPLMNLVLGMWCLIILFFASDEPQDSAA